MRDEILTGKLNYPGTAIFDKYPEQEKLIKQYWKSVWYNSLNGNNTNSLHWYDKMGIKLYNDVIRRLCHNGWITSTSLPGRKWASVELCVDKLLEFVTEDELEIVKAEYKYGKYLLSCDKSTVDNVVKQNGKEKETGLVREGFKEAGNTCFGLDVEMLAKHEDAVVKNLTKSMDKIRQCHPDMDSSISSYDEVSIAIYEHYSRNSEEVYTTGASFIDSRGRAISSCLNRVGNPVANKDFRSCLVITY